MQYLKVFLRGTPMRERIDAILAGDGDPLPAASNSPRVERMLAALAAGEANPYLQHGGRGRYRQPTPDEHGLTPRVYGALAELFPAGV